VASIHWGSNWGYEISPEQRDFAHRLVESETVDIVHGHSSHHPRGIEVHRRRPILYGCGDFVNDYEGIRGQEEFRSDLVLGYFLSLEPGSGDWRVSRWFPFGRCAFASSGPTGRKQNGFAGGRVRRAAPSEPPSSLQRTALSSSAGETYAGPSLILPPTRAARLECAGRAGGLESTLSF
jgi:hypothetical protein